MDCSFSPLLVLIMTVITKRIHVALITGIVTAALIATNYACGDTITIIFKHARALLANADNLYLYGFLFLVSILIVLIDRTGGARAFARIITKKIRNARDTQTASIFLSFALFIDDFLSNLTVGYVMQPIADHYDIPRTKLAYLVHSVSIPLIIITPISSWMAMITGQLSKAGVNPEIVANTSIIADPFYVYLKSIPYIFYSFLALSSLFFIVYKRLSFGPMRTHELQAQAKTTTAISPEEKSNTSTRSNDSIIDLVIPLFILVFTFIIGLLYTGGYHLFGGTRSLIETFKYNDQSFLVIFFAGLFACMVSIILALTRKKITIRDLGPIALEGIALMFSPISMLFLASILGQILSVELETGTYLASLLHQLLYASLLPCLFFIITAITSFLLGTSWATIALFIPIAIPMIVALSGTASPAATEQLPLLYPVLGAIFSGAVCGDNLSPISQTTMMAATSAGTTPFTHASTQLPYAIPAIFCTALAFLIIGLLLGYNTWLAIGIALIICMPLCLAALYLAHKMANQSPKKLMP